MSDTRAPQRRLKWFVLPVLGASLFMGGMDMTIPPSLERDVAISFAQARMMSTREPVLAQRIQESATQAFGEAFTLTTVVVAGALGVLAVVCWFAFDDGGTRSG